MIRFVPKEQELILRDRKVIERTNYQFTVRYNNKSVYVNPSKWTGQFWKFLASKGSSIPIVSWTNNKNVTIYNPLNVSQVIHDDSLHPALRIPGEIRVRNILQVTLDAVNWTPAGDLRIPVLVDPQFTNDDVVDRGRDLVPSVFVARALEQHVSWT